MNPLSSKTFVKVFTTRVEFVIKTVSRQKVSPKQQSAVKINSQSTFILALSAAR